jgi:maltooligosyltrehalose trehalohydrolase
VNDDFHHSAMVALTGRNEAYYTDYDGTPQELVAAAKYGFLYQGQRYAWQRQPRGRSAFDLPSYTFVNFLQNHDQVANSASGLRAGALTSPGKMRALTALLFLTPGTPMLFQGQEFGSSSPFLFFSDHNQEITELVRAGRAEFLRQFWSIRRAMPALELADPADPATFERCKLDLSERVKNRHIYALHKDLITLRKGDPVFQRAARRLDGAVLGARTFLLRFFGEESGDRLVLINLNIDFQPRIVPEPLIAPPAGKAWKVLLSTEDPRYGGGGVCIPEHKGKWRVPAESATVLAAEEKAS